jgi:hypothetical protein
MRDRRTGAAKPESKLRWWLWTPDSPLRAQRKFSCKIKLICPVQISAKKYFGFRHPQITSISASILSRLRGVSRSSRTLERDAVDAAVPAYGLISGRADEACEGSERAQTNGAFADGKIVWS